MRLCNVALPSRPSRPAPAWDIEVQGGRVSAVQEASIENHDAPPDLLLPPLCHPHIHLDKAYILAGGAGGRYTDLESHQGSFEEALANTSQAKHRYTADDLYLRGSQLLARSYDQGVTALRGFVEVDHVTGTLALEVAVRLKNDFAHLLQVQICAFAQDPIFSGPHAEANRSTMLSALAEFSSHIEALGTTPYVETDRSAETQNMEWTITTALRHGLHLDFHCDYSLSVGPERLQARLAVDLLKKHGWARLADGDGDGDGEAKTIVLGHCTGLTAVSDAQLRELAAAVRDSLLPIHFVGLPTSDLFMMGRPSPGDGQQKQARPRGTLMVPSLIKHLGLRACVGANNVGNPFTPYGSGDPLQLASWGVGIYQAGTADDAELLYGCVSWRARRAIGLLGAGGGDDSSDPAGSSLLAPGRVWEPMLLLRNQRTQVFPAASGEGGGLVVPLRQSLSYRDVVWDPPELNRRRVV